MWLGFRMRPDDRPENDALCRVGLLTGGEKNIYIYMCMYVYNSIYTRARACVINIYIYINVRKIVVCSRPIIVSVRPPATWRGRDESINRDRRPTGSSSRSGWNGCEIRMCGIRRAFRVDGTTTHERETFSSISLRRYTYIYIYIFSKQ